MVEVDTLTASIPCGPDIDLDLEAIREYEKAGFGELYVQQIGANQDDFFTAYREHILPHFEGAQPTPSGAPAGGPSRASSSRPPRG